ncbi:flavohemoglobin expression-modulating QEGLA motif protein [Flavobacterium sp. MXW15]|uniref:Flavohemoglobin expression-modulating QEGLA motif protein n=1 Tax=Xanthomonas chitinilytica TaxID=2989819 RepID=A0ABT3JTK8_9XANT|nr:flavohemoglobin expression-modulating QEGLA motif protein [Xanthomonas sp. H13-6]MCW4454524.1 flavohemoglobin expression-modulating QEGLA motif protein [Flavobacterium sp. MXW15]MCW4471763.1 flavohemoglobin expression-modulating QEGLA motif protein [Xanthomonas sp. H13-6]
MATFASPDGGIAHHAALDARLVDAVRGLRLLALTSWPASTQVPFLESVARGRPRLPQVEYPRLDFGDVRRELAAIAAAADPAHPLGRYLRDSVHSWDLGAGLLEALGTRAVDDYSAQLYGVPEQPMPGNGPTTREAALHFIQIAQELDHELLAPEEQVPVSATALQLQLQGDLDGFFDGRIISVELDPELIAKAAAGATRIRLRTGARFSAYDRAQLFHHEALVHSLTALNGREQAWLPSLALSSPRTTATQEGLATFAEQITGSIDIERLKRISLRIEAIAMARDGADFIEVFDYFRQAGQNPGESFASAQRVFRGVPPTGGAAFTKDTVYLRGLVAVHTFFRQMLREEKLQVCRWLFAGKMTLDDAVALAPLFEAGVLAPPRWLPHWISRANGLAGMLAFSLFANRIRMDRVGG